MAKNKNRPPASAFDKFKSDKPTTITVDEDDEADVQEETALVEVQPPDLNDDGDEQADSQDRVASGVAGPNVPLGAYQTLDQKAAQATTMQEQEAIIAAAHPKVDWEDPAVHYKRALTSGKEVPVVKIKADADPLLIETKELLERVLAGGLLVPGATHIYHLSYGLLSRIVDKIQEKPGAQPNEGSAGGASSMVG